jgi:hypothetical protein
MSSTLAKRFANTAGSVPGFDPKVLGRIDGVSDDVFKRLVKSDPEAFAPVLKNMDDADVSKILKNMDEADQIKIINKIDPDGTRNLGDLAKGTKSNNAMTVLAGGAGVGLALYINKKYDDAKEEFKNCMAGCLPENWDEYDQGSLEKSDLKYSTLETLEGNGIKPVDNQPYCTEKIDDCDSYCNGKCEEETDVDLPFQNTFEGLTGDLSELVGGLFKSLFGGLLGGLGIDPVMFGSVSSASSSMLCLVMIIMVAMPRR